MTATTFVRAALLLLPACSAMTPPVQRPARGELDPRLARFMREMVSIPYSFALFSIQQPERGRRAHHAAIALQDAAQDLVRWSEPPVGSVAAREVFYAYASDLEQRVARLELATRARDAELTTHTLQRIRETCNHCHRFFRPAARISADVVPDLYAFEQGGTP